MKNEKSFFGWKEKIFQYNFRWLARMSNEFRTKKSFLEKKTILKGQKEVSSNDDMTNFANFLLTIHKIIISLIIFPTSWHNLHPGLFSAYLRVFFMNLKWKSLPVTLSLHDKLPKLLDTPSLPLPFAFCKPARKRDNKNVIINAIILIIFVTNFGLFLRI